ncbi:hypothetical protein A3464_06925 [Enterobacter genomosp. O]|uniref:hypothetical protein n=1 Tax=Enterobacter genomosp. O TaxID=2364150 RepID=UPI0007B336AE|nr:hypothetical protein [Enterobacter genomosp. O]KZQ28030.1 hypothetical protein A3464_06925 [Enterobacter genomosp. O]
MDMNKYFLSKAFVEAQLWVFNGFAAVSLAFYFSLFSAGKPDEFSISLQIVVVLFGISLVSNASLAFLILVSDKDAEFINMLNSSKYFSWIPLIAMYSMLFAIITLILYYSWVAFFVTILTMAAVYWLFNKALSYEKKLTKQRTCEMQADCTSTMLKLCEMKNKEEQQKINGSGELE